MGNYFKTLTCLPYILFRNFFRCSRFQPCLYIYLYEQRYWLILLVPFVIDSLFLGALLYICFAFLLRCEHFFDGELLSPSCCYFNIFEFCRFGFFWWELNLNSLKMSVLQRCLNRLQLLKYKSDVPSLTLVPLCICLWEVKDILCFFASR